VRFVRLAAAAVILILATAVVVRLAGRRGGPAPAPVAPPPEDRVVDLKERVLHQEFREGRIVAEIRGASFFRGPDGRNHLTGSVDVENRGPAGEVLSRLSADEVVYDPDSLRFTVVGHVRVEAGGGAHDISGDDAHRLALGAFQLIAGAEEAQLLDG